MNAEEKAFAREAAEIAGMIADDDNFTAGSDIDLESIKDVPVEVNVVLGEATIALDDMLKMGSGAILKLNKKVGDAVDVYVNGRCVAKGEIVLVEDKIGVTMTEIRKVEK